MASNPYSTFSNAMNYIDGARRYMGNPLDENFFQGRFQLNQAYLNNYDPMVKGTAYWITLKTIHFTE